MQMINLSNAPARPRIRPKIREQMIHLSNANHITGGHPVVTAAQDVVKVTHLEAQHMENVTEHEQVASGYQKPAEVSTLTAPVAVMARARVSAIPSRPRVPQPLWEVAPTRPQITPQGKEVCNWYALIRATRVRDTDANRVACNGLAETDGLTFENLKGVIELLDDLPWVKDHNF